MLSSNKDESLNLECVKYLKLPKSGIAEPVFSSKRFTAIPLAQPDIAPVKLIIVSVENGIG